MKVLHVFTVSSTAEVFFDGQFAYLSGKGHEIHVASGTVLSPEFCARNDVRFHLMDIARRVDVRADFKVIRQLVKLMRNERFDAVFGHTPKGAMVAMMAARLAGVRHRVYYRHGLVYTTARGMRRCVFKTVERLTGFLATRIVNVSASLGKTAVGDRLNRADKQCVLGAGSCGGIDTRGMFNPGSVTEEALDKVRRELSIGKDDFVIGYTGRLCKEKGIRELIDGFRIFKSMRPELNAKLFLSGAYDERDILPDAYKAQIRDDDSIIYTGFRDRSIMPLFYSLMDVFVLPSYREGFGMSVIEASAMKVPVLVSRSNGCGDTMMENVTGRHIDITAEGIAKGLCDMSDKELRGQFGANGRRFVQELFDETVIWPEIDRFYLSL